MRAGVGVPRGRVHRDQAITEAARKMAVAAQFDPNEQDADLASSRDSQRAKALSLMASESQAIADADGCALGAALAVAAMHKASPLHRYPTSGAYHRAVRDQDRRMCRGVRQVLRENMASLTDVMTPRRTGERYVLEVIPGWNQGRGAFGGLVIGALIRAIEDSVADPSRLVRTVTAEIPGPIEVGTADIAIEVLRRGNNVSAVRAAMSQHGEVRAHAVAVLAATRSGDAPPPQWNDLVAPTLPHWTELPPRSGVAGAQHGFAANFEWRLVEGVPASGGPAVALGWIRALDPGPRRGAAYVAAMIDAWWPAGLNRLSAFRPMATLAFSLDIAGSVDALAADAPLVYRATSPVSRDGYSLETRELWSPDGQLIAVNHQTFVVIR
jgi:acyl-CoA thioesterase